MTPDLFGLLGTLVAVTVVVAFVIIALTVGLIVWSIRRRGALPDDPAVSELKGRYARGEIETAEYQVRLRELTGGD